VLYGEKLLVNLPKNLAVASKHKPLERFWIYNKKR